MNKPEAKTVRTLNLIECMRYTEEKHDFDVTATHSVRTRTWMVLTHEGFIERNDTYVSIPFADWVDDEDVIWSEIPDDVEVFMRKMVEDFDLKLDYENQNVLWEIRW